MVTNAPEPVIASDLECKGCNGPVRLAPFTGHYFHAEPRGFPQLQTIAREVGPIKEDK